MRRRSSKQNRQKQKSQKPSMLEPPKRCQARAMARIPGGGKWMRLANPFHSRWLQAAYRPGWVREQNRGTWWRGPGWRRRAREADARTNLDGRWRMRISMMRFPDSARRKRVYGSAVCRFGTVTGHHSHLVARRSRSPWLAASLNSPRDVDSQSADTVSPRWINRVAP